VGLRLKFRRFNDGSMDSPAPNQMIARAGFHFENHEAPLVLHQPRGRLNGSSFRYRFQMVHFDPRANGNRSSRQVRLNRLRSRYFHHPDHRWRRKHGRQLRVVMSESPFSRDYFVHHGLKAYAGALLRNSDQRSCTFRRLRWILRAL